MDKEKVKEEFSNYLQDLNLQSDDVSGVLKLSQAAHVNSEILSGPYRGLSQHESAIDVTTVINEQLNCLDSLKLQGIAGRLDSHVPIVDEELKRREMDTPGVMDAVYGGWRRFAEAEKCYKEIVSPDSLHHRRSDLTDDNSMRLYCSFLDQDVILTNQDIAYMTGSKHITNKTNCLLDKEEKSDFGSSRFITKARMLGIQVQRGKNFESSLPALFIHDEVENIPPGFEQINANLFARRDNRFMVFNRVGLGSWPPRSETKVGGVEDDMHILHPST